MQLIVGLGNPGSEYVRTRHNVGFKVIDALAVALSTRFSYQKKVHGQLAQKDDIFLLKPETFMNRSGEAVRATLEYFGEGKPTTEQLKHVFVIHDDLDIALGKYKIQQGKGPKVHNGLLSITQCLGSELYINVRVGIENRGTDRLLFPGGKYVLAPFTSIEEDKLRQVIPQIVQELLKLLGIE
jgi:PTH1 family peptidyl-tRNA hydrolase